MSGRSWAVVFFFATGLMALGGIYRLTRELSEPLGSGEVGRVVVFGQIPSGPTPLQPDRVRRLPRPQDFAFHFSSTGQGPRYIRFELEAGGRTSVVHEQRVGTPHPTDALEYVLRLGDEMPDQMALIVTVEAPHADSVTHRYPIELDGPERPFWEKPGE